MNLFIKELFALLALVVGVAIVAVIVGRGEQTARVTQSFFGGLSQFLGVAVSPASSAPPFGMGYSAY